MSEHGRVPMVHLDRMTDSTGVIQHAVYGVPRRSSGYTTDDNARALRLCVDLWSRSPTPRMLSRVTRYLSFLEHARCRTGRFHNLLSYQREWLDSEGEGDCQGQAIRALAAVLASSLPESCRMLARELIEGTLPTLADLGSIRAQAYIVLAWGQLRCADVAAIAPLETTAWFAAQRLLECYRRTARPHWEWFEHRVTYANAGLPHALFTASECWPREPFLEAAQSSFAFLDQVTTIGDVFWPIGNAGWYMKKSTRAFYDQQPIEAGMMAEAAVEAFRLCGEERYASAFRRACTWFSGHNSLNQPLCDPCSGSCCDGLQENGVNLNQGAESTLAYLSTTLRDGAVDRLRGATTITVLPAREA